MLLPKGTRRPESNIWSESNIFLLSPVTAYHMCTIHQLVAENISKTAKHFAYMEAFRIISLQLPIVITAAAAAAAVVAAMYKKIG